MYVEIPSNYRSVDRHSVITRISYSDNFRETCLVIAGRRIPCLKGKEHILIDIKNFPEFKKRIVFSFILKGEHTSPVSDGSYIISFGDIMGILDWEYDRFANGIVLWPPYIILYFYSRNNLREDYRRVLKAIIE